MHSEAPSWQKASRAKKSIQVRLLEQRFLRTAMSRTSAETRGKTRRREIRASRQVNRRRHAERCSTGRVSKQGGRKIRTRNLPNPEWRTACKIGMAGTLLQLPRTRMGANSALPADFGGRAVCSVWAEMKEVDSKRVEIFVWTLRTE